MLFHKTKLEGAYIIEPEKRQDDRGFFARVWCQEEFEKHGLNINLRQANMSRSLTKGTLRGMHYQIHPYEETKLIRCTKGALYDVIIDLRPNSPTYTQWIGVELTEDNHTMLYVPEGFAHGFLTLADDTEATYLVTEFYTPNSEAGIRYNDPLFAISWPNPVIHVSEKDGSHADFQKEIK